MFADAVLVGRNFAVYPLMIKRSQRRGFVLEAL